MLKTYFTKLRTTLLLALLSVAATNVWGETYELVTTFKSAQVVSGSAYQEQNNDDWYISIGGNNASVGFNKTAANAKKIGDALGTAANPEYYGSVIKSKKTINNISKITFTYGNSASGSEGKIYLAYSTDNITWNAVTLTSGTQGSSIMMNMSFVFSSIPSAYYAIILEKGSTTGVFRWDSVEANFYQSNDKTATTTTIDATGITNTDVYAGAEAGKLTAAVTADGMAVEGAVVAWESSNENVATIDEEGNVTLVASGTTTFTATYAGDDTYMASSANYELTVTDTTPFTGGDVTFDATKDMGTSPLTKNVVTFTCSSGALDNGSEYRLYKNSVTTFSVSEGVITKIAFEGVASNPVSGFAEGAGLEFDGNDGTWTGSLQSVSFTASGAQVRATKIVVTVDLNGTPTVSTIAEVRAQETGSVTTQGIVTSCVGKTAYIQDETAAICVYGEELTVGDEIRVSGSLTTFHGLLEIQNPDVVVISEGNTVTPAVKTVGEITDDIQGQLVKIENAVVTEIGENNVTTVAQGDNTVAIHSSEIAYPVGTKLTLTGNVGCYDAVQIVNPTDIEATYTRTVTAGNYGTICLPYATSATTGANFFTVSGKVMNGDELQSIVLEPVQGQLEAGKPYIFKATESELTATYTGYAVEEPVAGALVGTFEDITAPTGKYVLSQNQLYVVDSEVTIGANRAYIDLTDVPVTASGENTVKLMNGNATGIHEVTTGNGQQTTVIYDLQGRRVKNLQKGLYIVNGKKVLR